MKLYVSSVEILLPYLECKHVWPKWTQLPLMSEIYWFYGGTIN